MAKGLGLNRLAGGLCAAGLCVIVAIAAVPAGADDFSDLWRPQHDINEVMGANHGAFSAQPQRAENDETEERDLRDRRAIDRVGVPGRQFDGARRGNTVGARRRGVGVGRGGRF